MPRCCQLARRRLTRLYSPEGTMTRVAACSRIQEGEPFPPEYDVGSRGNPW